MIEITTVAKIVDFEAAMQAYMKSNNAELIAKINDTGDFNDEIEGAMKAALDKFKESATW
jgi:F-type H+-transporting ATPase subunit alpha